MKLVKWTQELAQGLTKYGMGSHKQEKHRVGHTITHCNSWDNYYDLLLSTVQQRHNITVYRLPSDLDLILLHSFCVFLFFRVLLYTQSIPRNTNNWYLALLLCFAPAKSAWLSCIIHNYKAGLQKPFLKKGMSKQSPCCCFCRTFWGLLVRFFFGLCCWHSKLPVVVVSRGHV